MSDLRRYLDEQLKGPAFRAEYEATRQEFALARALASGLGKELSISFR